MSLWNTNPIDRMYLNLCVPQLQSVVGVVGYLHKHHGQRLASTAALAPKSKAFSKWMKHFARREGIDIVRFRKGQRKDEVTREYLSRFQGAEGVLYIGVAREKARVMRTRRRRNRNTGHTYPWTVASTAIQLLLFLLRRHRYRPVLHQVLLLLLYNGKLYLNGNEYARRRLRNHGMEFESLDNGVRSCAGFDSAVIHALTHKWFERLPHPYTAQARNAGLGYDISILQAEFSLTQRCRTACSPGLVGGRGPREPRSRTPEPGSIDL